MASSTATVTVGPGTPSATPVATATETPTASATAIAKAVTEQTKSKREELQEEYGLTNKQVERDEKRTEQAVKDQVERAYTEHTIATKHLDDELKNAATEAAPPRSGL